MSKYGGVWLDISIVLLKPIDSWCTNIIDNEKYIFCANYENWGGSYENGFHGNDILNDWFLATIKDNPIVQKAHFVYKQYFNNRTIAEKSDKHEYFKKVYKRAFY